MSLIIDRDGIVLGMTTLNLFARIEINSLNTIQVAVARYFNELQATKTTHLSSLRKTRREKVRGYKA